MESPPRPLPHAFDADFRLLLATSRPPVRTFFESVGFHVGVIAVGGGTAANEPEQVARATVAVVDVALDPWAAVELCRELGAQRPTLRVAAVVCCQQALTPWTLSALLTAGVGSLIDLRSRAD